MPQAVIPAEHPITNVNPLNDRICFSFFLVSDGNVWRLTDLIPVQTMHH